MTLIRHQPVMLPRFTGSFNRSDEKPDLAPAAPGVDLTLAPKPIEIPARVIGKSYSREWVSPYWVTLALDAAQAVRYNIKPKQDFPVSLLTYNNLNENEMVSVVLVQKKKLFGGFKYQAVFNEFKGKLGNSEYRA